MRKVISRKIYDTETAEKIASNDFKDGNNEYSQGRTTRLYRTKKGGFFVLYLTCWQGENDSLEPISESEAIEIYENLSDQCESFESAFPGVEVEDA